MVTGNLQPADILLTTRTSLHTSLVFANTNLTEDRETLQDFFAEGEMENMKRLFRYLAPLLLLLLASTAFAQYTVTNLVSNQTGQATHTDPLLINAWGEDYAPGGPFWVADAGSGWSTLYDGSGNPQSLQVIVPAANGVGDWQPYRPGL